MKSTNTPDREFHVMEFIRQVRAEMNELYLHDRQQYLLSLKEAVKDYKASTIPPGTVEQPKKRKPNHSRCTTL
jgi:hypothetical protein